MEWIETLIGISAAFCTTAANIPQVQKSWTTKSADDLSLRMLILLITGVALWLVYGVFKGDAVIMIANGATVLLLAAVLYVKLGFLASSKPKIQ